MVAQTLGVPLGVDHGTAPWCSVPHMWTMDHGADLYAWNPLCMETLLTEPLCVPPHMWIMAQSLGDPPRMVGYVLIFGC